ncbi:uncharacterized protein LOC102716859 [Oryza brachyantha]|uniref:uncharacterized protein LOC102716859 n=1 Tax=Oryza brachyantha TaxID=4533 RepID=UPI0003EA9CF1|nr:uncharacterized protein LOC102716859 [Oryza brachyantha]
MAAPQRPLRRWNPFLAAFSSVDDAIEAADPGLLSRDEFRRARGRVVEMLRGAEDDAEAEELCLVLDEMMAESLLTLQIVPVTPERLATTDLAEVLGAMRKHESERIRGLATDIVRAWRATVKSDIVRMRSALERIPQSPKRVETGPNLEAKVKQGSSAPKKAITNGGCHVNPTKTSAPSPPKRSAPVVGGARVKTDDKGAGAKPKESAHPAKNLPAGISRLGDRQDGIKSYLRDPEKLAALAAPKRKLHEGYQEEEEAKKRRKMADMGAATKPKEPALPPKKAPVLVSSAGRRESIEHRNEDEMIASTTRKLRESYQEAEEARKRRQVHIIEDPKMLKQRQQKMHPIMRMRSRASSPSSIGEKEAQRVVASEALDL